MELAVKWPDPDKQKLLAMWAEGRSAREISDAFFGSYSRSSVLGKLHRMGKEGRQNQRKRKGAAPGAFGLDTWPKKKSRKKRKADEPVVATTRGVYVDPPIEPTDVPTKTLHELEMIGERLRPDQNRCCRHRIDVPYKGEKYGFCGREALPGLYVCETHAPRWYDNWLEIKSRYIPEPVKTEMENA